MPYPEINYLGERATAYSSSWGSVVCTEFALPSGEDIIEVGFNSVQNLNNVRVVFAEYNYTDNYISHFSDLINLTNAGEQWFVLSTPYSVPGTGTYRLAIYCTSSPTAAVVTQRTGSTASFNSTLTDGLNSGYTPIANRRLHCGVRYGTPTGDEGPYTWGGPGFSPLISSGGDAGVA